LFIGDIVGEPGRRAVREILPIFRQGHDVQMVIANGENSAGGSGITPNTAAEIFAAGVDIITSGDHLWDQKEVYDLLQKERVPSAAGLYSRNPWTGWTIVDGHRRWRL
jgi:calcineurin-like phosphoesterase